MKKPLRVLHVLGTTNLGGAESRIMDLYRHIDRERVQFDFLTHTSEAAHFDEEIKALGGRIYHLPRFRGFNYLTYQKAVRSFFRQHDGYRCVQGHMTSTAAIYLPAAKKAGIPLIAAHARSAGVDQGLKGKLTLLLRKNLSKKADYLFACSMLAGEKVFGRQACAEERIIYIPNAIPVDEFAFRMDTRKRMRAELHLSDRYVIGHVGRFHYAKNHEYLLQVFDELSRNKDFKIKKPMLLLLGEGDGMSAIKRQAAELGLTEQVIFLGNRHPAADYYQAMDYLVYPSRFEGLPGTVVEAQAAGLRCLISDTIAGEVLATDLVRTGSIAEDPAVWADMIVKTAEYERNNNMTDVIREKFDVREQAAKMMLFYETGNEEVLR